MKGIRGYSRIRDWLSVMAPACMGLAVLASCSNDTLEDAEAVKNIIVNQGASELEGPGITSESALSLAPPEIDFGPTEMGSKSTTEEMVIRNETKWDLFVQSIDLQGDGFILEERRGCSNAPHRLAPGSSCVISLSSSPLVSGPAEGVVRVRFDRDPSQSRYVVVGALGVRGVGELEFLGLKPIDQASVTTSRVRLGWEGVEGVSSYRVYGLPSMATAEQLRSAPEALLQSLPSGTETFVVTDLLPDTEYSFHVTALNELGIQDGNTKVVAVRTDKTGSFNLSALDGKEGLLFEQDLAEFCTDDQGVEPSFLAITSLDESALSCKIEGTALTCVPKFRVGHDVWTTRLALDCMLNDYPVPYSASVLVSVADTNRFPVVEGVAPRSGIAGQLFPVLNAADIRWTDPDEDSLLFSCRFDELTDAKVASDADNCAELLNADGSPAAFDPVTGSLVWTPPLSFGGRQLEFALVASDGALEAHSLFEVTVNHPPPSLSKSVLSLPSTTLGSGESIKALLVTKDSLGNNLVTGGATVSFSFGGGTSLVDLGSVSDLGDGRYEVILTGRRSGTVGYLTAVINGAPLSLSRPPLQVLPGAPSAVSSRITLARALLSSGDTTQVTLEAFDANGNRVTEGGASVAFFRSGGQSSGSFSPVVDGGDGTYTATFTALQAGSPTLIGATLGGVVVGTAKPELQVVPGPLDPEKTTIVLSSAAVKSGQSVQALITTRDSLSQALLSGGASLSLSMGGGTSTGVFGPVVDNQDGSYSVSITGVTAGTASIIEVSIGGQMAAQGASLTVTPGVPSLGQSTVTLAQSTVDSGQTTTVTLVPRDAAGNVSTFTNEEISFLLSGGGSSGSFSTASVGGTGVATATLTAITAGSPSSVLGFINGAPLSSAAPTLTVEAGSVSLAQSSVSVAAGTVAAGSEVEVILTLRDAAGNLVDEEGLDVSFSASGGTSTGTFGPVSKSGPAQYRAAFQGVGAGSVTSLRATVEGAPLVSPAASLSVVPGPVSRDESTVTLSSSLIVAGSITQITLQARDAFGNAHITGGLAVSFLLSGGTSSGSLSGVLDNGNGTYSAFLTGTTAGSPTSVIGRIGGLPLNSLPPTVSVSPGPASLGQSYVSVLAPTVQAGQATTIMLVTADAYGNPIATGGAGANIGFVKVSGVGTVALSGVTDNNNGTYSATVTGQGTGTLVLAGQISGASLVSSPALLEVLPGPASVSTSTLSFGVSSVAAGQSATLTLTLRDAYSNPLTSGGQAVVFSKQSGTSSGPLSPPLDEGDGRFTASLTGQVAGSPAAFTAAIGGAPLATSPATITVTPGPHSLANSSLTLERSAAVIGEVVLATVTVRDAFGNQLNSGGLDVALSKGAGSSDVGIGLVTDNTNGTYSAPLTAVGAGTALTIRASIAGQLLTSSFPSLVVDPPSVSPFESGISVSSETVASGSSVTVTLTARDAAGNDLTFGGSLVEFSYAEGGSTGTFSAVTDHGDGTYSAEFTGVLAGSPVAFGANIDTFPVSGPTESIEVLPGPVASLELSNVPAQALSGFALPTQPVVQLFDAAGNLCTQSSASVVLSVAPGYDGGALIGQVSLTATAGVADFSGLGVGFDTAGTQRLQADAESFSTSALATTEVIAPTLTLTNHSDPLRTAYNAPSLEASVSGTGAVDALLGATLDQTTPLLTLSGVAPSPAVDTSVPAVVSAPISPENLADPAKTWDLELTNNHPFSTGCGAVLPFDGNGIACALGPFQVLRSQLTPSDPAPGQSLAFHDGFATSEGLPVEQFVTRQMTDLRGETTADAIGSMTVFDGAFHIVANQALGSGNQRVLRLHDDPESPSFEVVTNTRGNSNDAPSFLGVHGDKLWMNSRNGSNRQKLFYLNDEGATLQIPDIRATNADDIPAEVTPFAGKYFFKANDVDGYQRLWVFDPDDGPSGSVRLVVKFNAAATDQIQAIHVWNSELYFSADVSPGVGKLFKISADLTTLTQAFDLKGEGVDEDIRDLRTFNGHLYFQAKRQDNGSGHYKLYRFNGTDVKQLTNIRNGNTDGIQDVRVFNGLLYFSASNGSNRRLYRVGLDESLTVVSSFNPTNDNVSASGLWDWNNDGTPDALVFAAAPVPAVMKLYALDASERIFQIADIVTGGNDAPQSGVSFGGRYYFPANNINAREKLYRIERK